jgi:predicted phosphodiesterase
MKILVISDIHANLTALEAVLNDAGKVDGVWCLGDLVGYGPDPNECIERIRFLPNVLCLIGNHDAAALGIINVESFNRDASIAALWTRDHLTVASRKYLESLPERLTTEYDVELVHGSPRNPVWEYLLDIYTAEDNFQFFKSRYCFVGHTHLPLAYICREGGKRVLLRQLKDGERLQLGERAILNPGSVGQPRDYDPRSAYAIFDTETKIWETHRVEYDILVVQKRILDAGLPTRHAERLAAGW